MVYAVGEPEALEIDLESGEILAVPVALEGGVDILHDPTYAEVVLSVLVEQDVTSPERRFLQVINEGFLLERELVETLDLVA